MTALYTLEDTAALSARIKVIGVGGGGGNALNNMIDQKLRGVEFIVANTDAQAIDRNHAEIKLQLGADITRGLGAGANPGIGREAAEAERDRIREFMQDTEMVFITAGMGGGTGTGAAPVIAEVAREMGVLTVAVVTKPFSFEGKRRMRQAEAGIAELRKYVDTLITIPNQKLIGAVGKNTSMLEAFRKADDVLLQAVRGIAELITHTGYMNVDFADVKAVMSETRGVAMMGSGVASGESRAIEAAERAISSPLLEDIDIHGAQGILVNVTGNEDMTLAEYDEAVSIIYNMADEDANIICGMVYDQDAGDEIRVTVVATGLSGESSLRLAAEAREKEVVKPAAARVPSVPMGTIPMQKTANQQPAKPQPMPFEQPGFNDDEFAVPTFLRRQAD
ncbi:cell division protein FtsZ [Mariprofundus erugo]|uniref:Cell division protein FtsZ n=1 Tax=Mariprofundus erugo TaxID=2528639 RepID=A0A5R9GQR3_9PROT|nr:cell division protein FtsZ [Mariprofundus erugo]TLS68260.1 cell division protein FtsZ [Mariprofundus erugo]TLS77116.1 cell division protein FtsZ [Mariprofundus erugo]